MPMRVPVRVPVLVLVLAHAPQAWTSMPQRRQRAETEMEGCCGFGCGAGQLLQL
jgi:hypothetical protein